MAISRWTRTRLQIVGVVALIGVGVGIASSWLLSRIEPFPYDVAEFEHGARSGLMAPEVRAVLHAGPIVAGECGDAKLSIVYLGDSLNTAARLEQTAKALDRSYLISGAPLRHLALPQGFAAVPLGPIALRGRQRPVDTYALEPSGSDQPALTSSQVPILADSPPEGAGASP